MHRHMHHARDNFFSDEASCVAFLFKRRWPDGFICPGCSERRAAVLKSRPRLYEC
ncbi:MAG: transposase, partial [Rhodoplanes sp.]